MKESTKIEDWVEMHFIKSSKCQFRRKTGVVIQSIDARNFRWGVIRSRVLNRIDEAKKQLMATNLCKVVLLDIDDNSLTDRDSLDSIFCCSGGMNPDDAGLIHNPNFFSNLDAILVFSNG